MPEKQISALLKNPINFPDKKNNRVLIHLDQAALVFPSSFTFIPISEHITAYLYGFVKILNIFVKVTGHKAHHFIGIAKRLSIKRKTGSPVTDSLHTVYFAVLFISSCLQ